MDISQIIELLFSDQSVKLICVAIAWDMRSKFKEMKFSVDKLAESLKALETSHSSKIQTLECRISKIEINQSQGGN